MFKSIQEKSERTKKELNQKMALIAKNVDALSITCTEEQWFHLQSIRYVIDDSYCLKQSGASLSLQMTKLMSPSISEPTCGTAPPLLFRWCNWAEVRLRVHPNGIKKGAHTHLSLIIECLQRDLHEPVKVECGCVNIQAIINKQADDCSSYDVDCIICECSYAVTSSTVQIRQYYKKYEYIPLKSLQKCTNDSLQFLVKWNTHDSPWLSCTCHCHEWSMHCSNVHVVDIKYSCYNYYGIIILYF